MKKLTFWNRFVEIWKPSFVSKLIKEKSVGKSWGFWFLSNTFLALILALSLAFSAKYWINNFPQNILPALETVKMVDENKEDFSLAKVLQNFELEYSDKILKIENIPQPLVFDNLQNKKDKYKFFGKIDTVKNYTDEESMQIVKKLSDYKNGFVVFKDRIISKDKNSVDILEFASFSDFETKTPIKFNLEKLKTGLIDYKIKILKIVFITTFIMFLIFLNVFRLIVVIIHALIFWGAGVLAKEKNWNFGKSLESVLHFQFITLLLAIISLFLMGFKIFFGWIPLAILSLIFMINFAYLKKNK